MKTAINFDNTLVVNKLHSSKIALLVTVITLSLMMILTTTIGEFDDKSIIAPITTISAIAGIIASAIIAASLKRPVYSQTESPLYSITIELAESKSDEIAKCAASNLWAKIPALAKDSHGTAMRLEVVYSKDKAFGAYQLFKYVPHTYEPCSQIIYIKKKDVARINFANLRA